MSPAAPPPGSKKRGEGRGARGERRPKAHPEASAALDAAEPQPEQRPGFIARACGKVQTGIDAGLRWYSRQLDRALQRRWTVVLSAAAALALVVGLLGTNLRREFFPEVDAGAFEMYVRLNTGSRLEVTEKKIAEVEDFVRQQLGSDLELILSQMGVWADWSSAYSPNSGEMDTVVKVQLTGERSHTSQHYAELLRDGMARDPHFAMLEVAFNTGGTIRSPQRRRRDAHQRAH